VLPVELLEGVVGEHGGTRALRDQQEEGVPAADGPRRRGDDLPVGLGLLEGRPLAVVDPVSEGGVHHHRDLGVGILLLKGPDRLVELGKTGQGPTLGGDVGTVDDYLARRHVSCSQPFPHDPEGDPGRRRAGGS
jgi:hypothetical protein